MKKFLITLTMLMAMSVGIFAQDSQPPTITITNPVNYGTVQVRELTTIIADAYDETGVWFVHFYVDGKLICYDFDYPYTCDWTPTKRKNYALFARAFDLPFGSSMNMTTSQAIVATAVR